LPPQAETLGIVVENSNSGILESNKLPLSDMKVVVADDQLINIEVIKSHLAELGLAGSCCFCINGQETIDAVKSIVVEALTNRND
jgi:hypothetical protein